MLDLFDKTKLSPAERARVFDFLMFKIKHGGNVGQALRSYMDNNTVKASMPVQLMLDDMANGENFQDVALRYGLVDQYGFLILSSNIEPAKALPVIKNGNLADSHGITTIIIKDILIKWITGLVLGIALFIDYTSRPIISVFEKMGQAGKAAGAAIDPLPIYLHYSWLVLVCVLAVGLMVAAVLYWLYDMNKNQTDRLYRICRFRFYEDWVNLLSLYLAFKEAGQSDFKAAHSLAAACPEDSFTRELFTDMGNAMRTKGRSFYAVMAQHEGAIPAQVLTFFMDASKTGQIDAYVMQARDYCRLELSRLTEATRIWVPAISGVVMLMTFGLMVADLFISITLISMKPITG